MVSRQYQLDDDRKIRYWLAEWTNSETGETYYNVNVSLYEKRRRFITLGLTDTWRRSEQQSERYVEHDEESLREAIEELRSIVVGESDHPLEILLDDILADIEPEHND